MNRICENHDENTMKTRVQPRKKKIQDELSGDKAELSALGGERKKLTFRGTFPGRNLRMSTDRKGSSREEKKKKRKRKRKSFTSAAFLQRSK